jgi:hypothetical protein
VTVRKENPEARLDPKSTPLSPVVAEQPPAPVPATSMPAKPAATLRQTGQPAGETGGPKGPEPTRYGDWEKGGRCFDF